MTKAFSFQSPNVSSPFHLLFYGLSVFPMPLNRFFLLSYNVVCTGCTCGGWICGVLPREKLIPSVKPSSWHGVSSHTHNTEMSQLGITEIVFENKLYFISFLYSFSLICLRHHLGHIFADTVLIFLLIISTYLCLLRLVRIFWCDYIGSLIFSVLLVVIIALPLHTEIALQVTVLNARTLSGKNN